jgi:carbon storage regulator
MLVFTRKRGDAVAVGERRGGEHLLKVTVLEIRGSIVKLGFEAASDVAVHRWEVWQRIRSENAAGAVRSPRTSRDHWDVNGGSCSDSERTRAPRD